MSKELVLAICESCNYAFKLYRDSLVYSSYRRRSNLEKELVKEFIYCLVFNRYYCAECFFNHYKYVITDIIDIGKVRFKEFNNNKWLSAQLL